MGFRKEAFFRLLKNARPRLRGDGVCMLRFIPRHSTYFYVRLIPRVLRALHLSIPHQARDRLLNSLR